MNLNGECSRAAAAGSGAAMCRSARGGFLEERGTKGLVRRDRERRRDPRRVISAFRKRNRGEMDRIETQAERAANVVMERIPHHRDLGRMEGPPGEDRVKGLAARLSIP